MFTIFATGDFVKMKLSLFVLHITFSFDMYFLRGFRVTAWNTKDISFGGTGLTNISSIHIEQARTKKCLF